MLLNKEEVRGRTLICLSDRSLSRAIDDAPMMSYAGFPVLPPALSIFYEKKIDGANAFFVAMQNGGIRRIIYAVPDDEWAGVSQRITGRADSHPPIDVSYRGSQVLVYTMAALPQIDEQVILYIDSQLAKKLGQDGISGYVDKMQINYDLSFIATG